MGKPPIGLNTQEINTLISECDQTLAEVRDKGRQHIEMLRYDLIDRIVGMSHQDVVTSYVALTATHREDRS